MVVTLRSSAREPRAEAARAHGPSAGLFDYSSSDEGDGDRGDQTWVPSGPEGFDMSAKSPPGSPMEADETAAPGKNVEFNLGAGSFTPKTSRRSRSNARSGHARGSRRAASPMSPTPPPPSGSDSPESPSVASFFDRDVSWPVRSGSRTRDGGLQGGPRRSASTPTPTTHANASGATPESGASKPSTTTPFPERTGVFGDMSPFGSPPNAAGSPGPPDVTFHGFGARDVSTGDGARGTPRAPEPFAAAKKPSSDAAPPVTEFADLSFNLGSGGGRRASGASARRRGSTRGVSPGASPGKAKKGPPIGASAFASGAASVFPRARPETNAGGGAAPFQFTPPPPAPSPSAFPTFGDAWTTVGAPFAPGAFAPGSGDPKPAAGRSKRTPKKKLSASARAASFASTPRSPTEAAKDRIPPSIFAPSSSSSSPPASPATASRRSPLRRANRPQKSASPTPSPPSSPMDILRERVASVNLGGGDAPDSAAAAHRAAAAGAANVSFTFSNAHASSPFGAARAGPPASEATRLKEAGNAAFKAGRYQAASANYDEALERMAREFPTEPVPEALRDACLADEADTPLTKRACFVAGGRDAAVCYANRAAARLMNVNDAARREKSAPEGTVAGDARAPATRRALAAASDVRAALGDCRAALAADPSFRRARLRAGTCLMRLGAFEGARAEFLLAAEGDAGGTAAEARRLAEDAARGAALVDRLTRADGGALASLRRHCVDGASVGARRVKARVLRAAEGDGGFDADGDDDFASDASDDASSKTELFDVDTSAGGSRAPRMSVAATARDVLRSVRDISAVAPHCAAVAEAKARALLWEGRFGAAEAAADAEGLGGAAHRRGGGAPRDASLAEASPRAFASETGAEAWRARVRAAARFATGDLAGAVAALTSRGESRAARDDGDGGGPGGGGSGSPAVDPEPDPEPETVMNDDARLVAARAAEALEAAERGAFAALLRAASAAHTLRAQGNAEFKAKAYARAAETYSRAVDAVADAPGGALSAAFAAVCLCNRAAAAHAEGRAADALADCGRALALNPARVKSLSRRAQLYAETRMHDAAADDLRRLLATLGLGETTAGGAEEKRLKNASSRAALADAAAGAETFSSEARDGVAARLREARAATRGAPVPDHVAVLGLRAVLSSAPASAGAVADSDVKKAYRRLALKHHPDKSCAGLPGWADAEALRRDADAVFKLVGEAHAALASAEKRRAFDASDRKARAASGGRASSSSAADFGFSTFARDAARHASSRGGGSRGGARRAGGAYRDGGGGGFYGDWFGEDNRASGRGAYRPRRSGGGGGYKT